MDFFKYFYFGLKCKYKYLIVGVIIAIIIFNVLSVFGFCSSEDGVLLTDYITFNAGIYRLDNRLRLLPNDSSKVYCFKAVRGYTYKIVVPDNVDEFYVGSSDTLYKSNDDIFISFLSITREYTFTADTDSYYYYYGRNSYSSDTVPLVYIINSSGSGYSKAIFGVASDLTSVSFWDVFKTSIPYISIIVIVGLGFFSIARLVDKSFIQR